MRSFTHSTALVTKQTTDFAGNSPDAFPFLTQPTTPSPAEMMGDLPVRAVAVKGRPWLHGQEVAQALGYQKNNCPKVVHSHVRPEHRQARHELEEGCTEEDTYISEEGVHMMCAKCPREDRVQMVQDALAQATASLREQEVARRVEEMRQQEMPTEQDVQDIQVSLPSQAWEARCSRLQAVAHAFSFAEHLDINSKEQLKRHARRCIDEVCLPEGEAPGESVNAAQLLRERGCNEQQVARMASELGKDLLLVSRDDPRYIDRVNGHTRIPHYHRVKDAALINTVMASFMRRPLWQRVMTAPADPERERILQRVTNSGRGR